MKITILDTHEEVSQTASAMILLQLETDRNLLLCAATGNTPSRTYELLTLEYGRRPEYFSGLRVVKLDEWGGIAMTDPGSCEYYLRTRLIDPLQIDSRRYLGFHSNPQYPAEECRRMQAELAKAGPIDCCVLGLGLNGHLGFNEPAGYLHPGCHIAQLSAATLQHTMVTDMRNHPSYGMTLGMADILRAKMVLILISGSSKKAIVREFLSERVTPQLPASFLWLHSNVICLLDKAAASDV